MIPAPMGADFDFEDVAVGRAGDFLEWLAATGTAFLVVGQRAVFIRDRQVIVVASTMALAAALLSTRAWFSVPWRSIGFWIRGGRSFGFSTVQTAFQFADFALETLNLSLQVSFALDGPLMLSTPEVSLRTQFNDLPSQISDGI
jgi:hypothetical protein